MPASIHSTSAAAESCTRARNGGPASGASSQRVAISSTSAAGACGTSSTRSAEPAPERGSEQELRELLHAVELFDRIRVATLNLLAAEAIDEHRVQVAIAAQPGRAVDLTDARLLHAAER